MKNEISISLSCKYDDTDNKDYPHLYLYQCLISPTSDLSLKNNNNKAIKRTVMCHLKKYDNNLKTVGWHVGYLKDILARDPSLSKNMHRTGKVLIFYQLFCTGSLSGAAATGAELQT